ncbi:XdhC family protein [Candidatus Poriferisodalis sp.]|uniref:XdhC family protein n=1 Tax=Candidatus Poriferisodalis sp. TaxID=3101277 RepID=UPI003B01F980
MSQSRRAGPSLIGHSAVEGWRVLERAVDLARSGEAFVLATVVWREGPSSGQQGSRAIYTASGEMYGWIGGACAEPTFIREAKATLEAGSPRLLALGASDRFGDLQPEAEPAGEAVARAARERSEQEREAIAGHAGVCAFPRCFPGTTAVPMSCQSEGALQIYLEPVVAVPHVVIVGSSPMAVTLAVLAQELDWRVERVSGAEFSEGLLTPQSIVVVATQGHGDEDVLAAALKAAPAYVGLVASSRRGESVRAVLASQGVGESGLDALRYPAGLDLGSTSHKEVAVSILAELVQLRAQGAFAAPVTAQPPGTALAVDPVCGMTVQIDSSAHLLEVGDEVFYFCCAGCRSTFAREQGVT